MDNSISERITIAQEIEEILERLKSESALNEDPRAKSLTVTKLEEAQMWAERIEVKSIPE